MLDVWVIRLLGKHTPPHPRPDCPSALPNLTRGLLVRWHGRDRGHKLDAPVFGVWHHLLFVRRLAGPDRRGHGRCTAKPPVRGRGAEITGRRGAGPQPDRCAKPNDLRNSRLLVHSISIPATKTYAVPCQLCHGIRSTTQARMRQHGWTQKTGASCSILERGLN